MRLSTPRRGALALLLALLAAHAGAEPAEDFAWHGQSTWIWQAKPGLHAAYSGANSLSTRREKSYSFTATLGAGARLWDGAEAWINGEAVQGVPMSGLVGLGGLTNGELQKTAGAKVKTYLPRAFVRQTWALGGGTEDAEGEMNQLAGARAAPRLTLTAGMLAVSDLFDDNAYAHDPRTQLLNWAFLTHGHFDYAADSRGYSRGVALEWTGDVHSLRAGRFEVPLQSNGLKLDSALGHHHGDQVEWERRWRLGEGEGRAGALRVLGFRNVARMARFDDALAAAAASGGPPTLDGVRRDQAKRGGGLALEQALPGGMGLFARLGRHDGATEPYSFTSVDRAASFGVEWRGGRWGRPDDRLTLGVAQHGLSPAHRRFLAAGGTDFFLGDGALRYGPEQIVEALYAVALAPGLSVSFDVQHIAHPAYNRDRGPAQALGVRLHFER